MLRGRPQLYRDPGLGIKPDEVVERELIHLVSRDLRDTWLSYTQTLGSLRLRDPLPMPGDDSEPPPRTRTRRWRSGCGRAPWTRWSASRTCSGPGRRCAGWSRADAADVADPVGPPGTGKTTLATSSSAADRPALRRSCPRFRRGQGRPGGHRRRPGASSAYTGRQTVLFIDEMHRFSKTQQDSCCGAVEDRHGHAGRGDHREPVLLGGLAAAVAQPAAAAAAADRRRHRAAGRPGADRRARAGRRGHARPTRREAHLVRLAGGDARRALTALEARPARRSPTGDDARSTWPTLEHGGRPRRGALRPARRPALRRDQRVHQVDPRLATSTPRCTTWPG